MKYIEKKMSAPLMSCILTILVLVSMYLIMGYAPFGGKTIAAMDANIQYLDFFAYLKNVLLGKDGINYSYTSLLGGSNISLVSYYLMSPLNLLVIFFKKSQLGIFFNLIYLLKLALAAATMTYFLKKVTEDKLSYAFSVILGICYALMQYNLAQGSNIIWLDGVYMLPLILLGVHYLVVGKKSVLLSVAVGCSIIFNWYTGGINCLFAGLWFIFELVLQTKFSSDELIKGFKKCIYFVLNMLLGVMLSAFIFIPAVVALGNGSRNQMDWAVLTNTFRGNVLSLVERYIIGGQSDTTGVSLFSGSVVLLGVVAYFFLKKVSVKKKITTLLFGIVVVLTLYWQPAYFVFSLLKQVDSYWCRFSYVAIAFLIYVAAQFYIEYEKSSFYKYGLVGIASIYSVAEIVMHRHDLTWNVISSIIFCIVIATLLTVPKRNWTNSLALVLVIMELMVSAYPLLKFYSYADNQSFASYELQAEKQVNELKQYDSSNYRVTQTSPRGVMDDGIVANYNEGMAFNYWSISSYVSSQSRMQLDILNSLGYRSEQDRITVVNSPIISSDALLGVKYIFSRYPVNGLTKINKLGIYNDKATYKNKYAFPLAFIGDGKAVNTQGDWSTFVYQNRLFNNLYGKDIDLFQTVVYKQSVDGNNIKYKLILPVGSYALYGNIIWAKNMDAVLDVNNKTKIAYAKWLSPSVFYIPTNNSDKSATVTLTSSVNGLAIANQEFYALNLDKLKLVSEKANKNAVPVSFSKKSMAIKVTSTKKNQYLYLAFPKDKSWKITVNGKVVVPETYANGLMVIPLGRGTNNLRLTYKVVHQKLGILITVIGILSVGMLFYINKRWR